MLHDPCFFKLDMISSVKIWFNERCLLMAFSTGCHGDMQMKANTLSSFSGIYNIIGEQNAVEKYNSTCKRDMKTRTN